MLSSLDSAHDRRVVMTLDAGGTSFRFSAMRGNQSVTPTVTTPSYGDNLERCLATLVEGFTQIQNQCPTPPVAISFAFPGPADYPMGVIGDLGNLPCFRGGVALGPMLADKFGIPVYINNDGDLFVYGEAIAGYLPYVNGLLEQAGSPKRYRNLFGITLGTGLGGGIVRDQQLFRGDNSMAGEIWLLRNKLDRQMNAEEGACIRAVQRAYAEKAGIALAEAPTPKSIHEIAQGLTPGNQAAAIESFRRLGEVAGDAAANALTLIDGLLVVGGGIAHAHRYFLPTLVAELNSTYTGPKGNTYRRLVPQAFNLENEPERAQFLKGDTHEIVIPGTTKTLAYDPMPRLGVGVSRLGTSEAVAIGAYAFALHELDQPA